MKRNFFFNVSLLFLSFFIVNEIKAQIIPDSIKDNIGTYLTEFANKDVKTGRIKIDSVNMKGKTISFFAGVNLSYIPFQKNEVDVIYNKIKGLLPEKYKKYKVELITDTRKVEDLVLFGKEKKQLFANTLDKPLVSNLSQPYVADRGLQNHHLAIWQSHGWYYEQKLARWEWQRARIFQTVEDLYTQSYVLPYLVPMLENAGANVLLPRERDIQRHEIIVDNDRNKDKSIYKEINGKDSWTVGYYEGFAYLKESYLDGENPFRSGSYKEVKTIKNGEESRCEWIPDIPENGKYGVYISYKTLANSTDDARYTVYHKGGKTDFSINQKMGGGTWIFLGYFSFDKGINENCKVVLTNKSNKAGRILTADAVKIGGGMGNIARLPHASGIVTDNTKSSETIENDNIKKLPAIDYKPEVSGYPRYTEGARYWLQWAGAPDSIYNKSEGKNDYTDDYQSRGFWVNYIAGGSSVLPKKDGLNIPIDLAMAFHTDAGTTFNDSIIGSLGIYMTHHNDEKFENGKTRWASRDLTELIMDEIVKDIRREYEPQWTRRHMWNRSYSEARVPNVPTMLLELLSHQNFADMKYGLDPRFRFTVSRSIYKGMLKFVAHQYGYDYVVQPLPVRSFSAQFSGDTQVELKWKPVDDVTEPSAKPDQYIVYTRIGDGDFDNGKVVNGTSAIMPIEKEVLYSFKITAVNKGGQSFPSEILSVCKKSEEKGQVLIVNGFDRLSAPYSFASRDSIGGFLDFIDHGVPDKVEYNYIGSQYEFRRVIPWMDDDAAGFGASNANYETTVVAGNTFDYPSMHGRSIAAAGYSFVSVSRDAILDGAVNMNSYKLVDLILGKQRQTKIGRGVSSVEFKTFTKELQSKITDYCKQGGNIFISGAYVASDLWDTEKPQIEDQKFAADVLKYKWRVGRAAVEGKVKTIASPFPIFSGNYEFYTKLNSIAYAVESPDALEPAGDNSYTVFRYTENNLSAGIAHDGDYKTCVIGFPFEAIKDQAERDSLMSNILSFMFK
ncbi:xanthan lyase [uncultured Dysgonomonas sp.]|uniref:golvesin C-terminal-like domain-containing protein n=1 Tax=uncultured Dysgonomonas sp. TaxID=206096 RepID=UPI0028054679|nr:xanthan lyase [uncultured Dysgonomonas sp.]